MTHKQLIASVVTVLCQANSITPCTAASLTQGHADLIGMTEKQLLAAAVALLCDQAGGDCPQDMQVAWTPTNLKLGEEVSFVSDQVQGDAVITAATLIFSEAVFRGRVIIDSAPNLTSVSFPNLVSMVDSFTSMEIHDCPLLASFSAPLLHDTNGTINLAANALVSVSFPSLVSSGGSGDTLNLANNAGLTTVSLPVWVPHNNLLINMTGCSLDSASVNHVLARCVANAAYVAGDIQLQGVNNAAPTGQGINDKATLIGRGVTVSTT